ncbi:hypothetical protein L6Y89_05275 [Enterobacter mori]|nr:hypothetical protein [Enterobacter mori]UKJ22405.1 hypothetical protein L6Y89_05275 [Enterobacter mori]
MFAVAVERPQVKCIISQMGFADGEVIVTGNNNALISADYFRLHFTPALAGFFIRAARAKKNVHRCARINRRLIDFIIFGLKVFLIFN